MDVADECTTATTKDRGHLKPKSVVYNDHLRQQALHVQRGLDNVSKRYMQPEPRNDVQSVMFNERDVICSILHEAGDPAGEISPGWLFWMESGKSTSTSPDEPT
eukprot:jgi/Chrzof1/10069/Cz04g25300.t1